MVKLSQFYETIDYFIVFRRSPSTTNSVINNGFLERRQFPSIRPLMYTIHIFSRHLGAVTTNLMSIYVRKKIVLRVLITFFQTVNTDLKKKIGREMHVPHAFFIFIRMMYFSCF